MGNTKSISYMQQVDNIDMADNIKDNIRSVKDINGNIWMKTNKGWIRMLDNSFRLKQPECLAI